MSMMTNNKKVNAPMLVLHSMNEGSPLDHVFHQSLVRLIDGSLSDIRDLNGLQKFIYRDAPVLSLNMSNQTLVFRKDYYVSGFQINVRCSLDVSIDRNGQLRFINTFHKGQTSLNTGYVVSQLFNIICGAVAKELRALNPNTVSIGGSVTPSSSFTNAVSGTCRNCGLFLRNADLRIMSISYGHNTGAA